MSPTYPIVFERTLTLRLKNIPELGWGSGLYQRVIELQETRKGYVHRFLSEADLFPEAMVADQAIDIARAAIEAIYKHVGSPPPPWIQDDDDRGWDN
jgi:hypothetical protein